MDTVLRSTLNALCGIALIGCSGHAGGMTDGGPTVDGSSTGMDGGPGAGSDGGGGSSDGGGVSNDGGGGSSDGGGGSSDGGGGGGQSDAGSFTGDAGPACGGGAFGHCGSGLSCLCCPAGGAAVHCLCSTHCASSADCTDSSRPYCDKSSLGGGSASGICTPSATNPGCLWGAVCASPDTPIATPKGERPIADLREGDLVLSLHRGQLAAVPIERVSRTPVSNHAVVHVGLETGRVLEISAGHPTADGRPFGDLAPGDRLDGVEVVEVRTVPYEHGFTYDILPASDTGTYVAGGVLIGSTLSAR